MVVTVQVIFLLGCNRWAFPVMEQPLSCPLFPAGFFMSLVHVLQFSKLCTIFPCDLLFYSEKGGDRFIQNVGTYWTNNTVSHPRTQCYLSSK